MKWDKSTMRINPSLLSLVDLSNLGLALPIQPVHFRMKTFLQRFDELHCLEAPFTKVEIDEVIKNQPTDKALGLGGFNGAYIKACWDIITTYLYSH